MKTHSPRIVRWLALGGIAAALCLFTQLGSSSARAADENKGQFSSSDYRFVVNAYRGNSDEIALAKLASQKATDPAVQQFAQRMVQDHTKANQQLEQIVSQKGATLPSATTTSEERESEHLAKLSGSDFDKAYMNHMVKEHKKDVKEFQKEANNTNDPDLKAYAANTVPILQEHLQMAQNTDAALKGSKP